MSNKLPVNKPSLSRSLSAEAGEFVPVSVKKAEEEQRGYDPRDEVPGFMNFRGSPTELLTFAAMGIAMGGMSGVSLGAHFSAGQTQGAPRGRRPRPIQESDPMVSFLFRHLRNNGPRGY